MSAPTTFTVSASPATAQGLAGALHAGVRRISWRVVGITVLIMLALDAWMIFDFASVSDPTQPASAGYFSEAIIVLLMTFSIMFATLVADEFVDRGARRLPAYASAVAIGAAIASLAQWEVHEWLHLSTRFHPPWGSHETVFLQPMYVFLEYLIWGSVIVFIYVNHRSALRAAAQMNRVQVQRADAQRRTLESRLQALQARVEPRFLLDTLAQVHALYDRDPVQGSQMLGELIVYLRAALPHLRDSTSTLEQELKLVGAYLGIMRVHSGERLEFAIDATQPEFAARVPPMVLLPLVNHLLADGLEASSAGSTVRIAARTRGEALSVELSAQDRCLANGGSSTSINDIRERLHALYGARGTLACESSTTLGTRMMLEIPYESADGGHR